MKESQKYYSLASTFALIFVFLGYVVKFYPQTIAFENLFQKWFRGGLPTFPTKFFLWITQFGNPLSLILLTITFMIFFYLQKEKISSLYLGLNLILGAGLLNSLMKLVYHRPRPQIPHLVTETSYSFPSGHAMGSMILFGTLILLVSQMTTNKYVATFIRFLCGLMIFLIGLSRIYLGVHYPSDILGGYLLGLVWLLSTYSLYKKMRFKHHFKNTWKKVK